MLCERSWGLPATSVASATLAKTARNFGKLMKGRAARPLVGRSEATFYCLAAAFIPNSRRQHGARGLRAATAASSSSSSAAAAAADRCRLELASHSASGLLHTPRMLLARLSSLSTPLWC